jgi:hypothetical protein
VSSREEIKRTSYDGLSLDEVVPQHASRVLEHPDERRHLDLIPVNRRSTPAIGGKVQLSQIGEAGESPIALLGDETVMSV